MTQQIVPIDAAAVEDALPDMEANGATIRAGEYSATSVVRNSVAPITLYDRRSGVSTIVNTYGSRKVVEDMLAKTDRDPRSPYFGKKVFTARSPEQEPGLFYNLAVRGTTPCMLNPKHPRFAEFRAMGFGICPRGDLPNEQEADAHAKTAHIRAYPRVKELDAAKRAETEAARSALALEAIAPGAGGVAPRRGPGRPPKGAA